MKRIAWLVAALAATPALVSTPTLASPCSQRIDALSKQVKSESTAAIAASTSGKETAARREGEGLTGTGGESDRRTAPPAQAAEAGKGAEAAQQAKVALDEARTADAKGDAKGCEAAVTRAEQQLKTAP
ncbi:hypothetical protein [Methylobacterium dankookense]|uniref:Uncharacterized protein n=1 Tax=Methylobacterium dankookense TaxID=560405 RepID=A0A564FUH4_9HYPH|nr:hypothetical protein [Methylobacterium dankookense]GJD56001.1 hypothetical protein IFDJLNFL_1893 [Methylobacterium dankookense]VUF11406.1 hypothetical protein MTDSW087_01088 [Methylobacterium dankookense]